MRIANIANVTAKAPNAISDQGVVGLRLRIPMVTFGFRASARSMNVPFSLTVTYQADNMPSQAAVIQAPFRR